MSEIKCVKVALPFTTIPDKENSSTKVTEEEDKEGKDKEIGETEEEG